MKIIFGYDTSYNSALEQAGINKLSDCRQHLCDKFFSKVIANPADRLYNLVPHNENQRNYLRNLRPFRRWLHGEISARAGISARLLTH